MFRHDVPEILAVPVLANLIRMRGCVVQGPGGVSAVVDPAEDLLRRLAFNDERVLGMVLTGRLDPGHESALGAKNGPLVRLAALLAIGAATPSLREVVDQARAAGASQGEIVGVLVSVGPTIGLAGLVASAPRLALAIGYDLENDHDPAEPEGPSPARGGGVGRVG
jgi:4-carboxymuconolactone decarboxylase